MNLVEITGGGLLDASAAAQWELLSAAFAAEFGAPPRVTSAYRSRAEQRKLYDRWLTVPGAPLAAKPGRSLHERGLAVDVGSGVNIGGSRQHQWMRAHAPAYGWAVGVIRSEPWHIEYTLTPTITPSPAPEREEDDMTKARIIQAFGLPDQGVIGGGLAYAFPNEAQLNHFLNVERPFNPDIDKKQIVGDASMTEQQRRDVFNQIIEIYASAQGIQRTLATVRADIGKLPRR